MTRYTLENNMKVKYIPIVRQFLKEIEENDQKVSQNLLEKDFSNTELNPYTLCELLKVLGYEKGTQYDCGWQFDFWIPFTKDGCKPIQVEGCGITFELKLVEKETRT